MTHEARIKAHKANIDRYCRLLATQLTELERDYLHNRIMQEHAALSRLEAEAIAAHDRPDSPARCDYFPKPIHAPPAEQRS